MSGDARPVDQALREPTRDRWQDEFTAYHLDPATFQGAKRPPNYRTDYWINSAYH